MLQRTLLSIALMGGSLGLAQADDWPQWRGPHRTGVSKETGLLQAWPPGGPKLLWTFRDAGEGYSCMSIVGDRLYSMGADDTKEYVYAIDLNTRKKFWSTQVDARWESKTNYGYGEGPCSTPTIDGNYLYALSRNGSLVCMETISGKKVWSQELKTRLGGETEDGWGYCESPLVDGDQVVATPGGKQGAIAAFDKKTGKLKWRCTTVTDRVWYSSMIAIEVSGVRQYVQSTNIYVVGVRASDGKLLWQYLPPRRAHYATTPSFWDDCVYVPIDVSCHLLKLKPDGNKFKVDRIYTNGNMTGHHGGVILVGEYLYGPSRKRECAWTCQDFKTGKVVWSKKIPRVGAGSITCADGNLYCYHQHKGDVLLLKATPAGYQEQGKFCIPEETKIPRNKGQIYTHPVVANGKLYLRDHDLIFCYDVRKPQ